jgi:hypothetical protein
VKDAWGGDDMPNWTAAVLAMIEVSLSLESLNQRLLPSLDSVAMVHVYLGVTGQIHSTRVDCELHLSECDRNYKMNSSPRESVLLRMTADGCLNLCDPPQVQRQSWSSL